MQKKFKAGQLYELSYLLSQVYSLEPLDLRTYIKRRIDELENEPEMLGSAHSANRRQPSPPNGKTFLDDDED